MQIKIPLPYENSLCGNRVVFMRKDTERAHFEHALYNKHPEFKNMTFLHDHFSYGKCSMHAEKVRNGFTLSTNIGRFVD